MSEAEICPGEKWLQERSPMGDFWKCEDCGFIAMHTAPEAHVKAPPWMTTVGRPAKHPNDCGCPHCAWADQFGTT